MSKEKIMKIATYATSAMGLLGLSINQMYAATVSATGGVKFDQTDLDNIGTSTQAYASTQLESFKLLGYGIAIWGTKFLINKAFGLFGGTANA